MISKFQIKDLCGHVKRVEWENGGSKSYGLEEKKDLVQVKNRRISWAEKGKWMDQRRPSRLVARKKHKMIWRPISVQSVPPKSKLKEGEGLSTQQEEKKKGHREKMLTKMIGRTGTVLFGYQ